MQYVVSLFASLCYFLITRLMPFNIIFMFFVLYFCLLWVGHVTRIGEGRGVHRVLVGKPEGKRPLGRPRRRWEDNIKLDLQEMGGGCGDWMELAG